MKSAYQGKWVCFRFEAKKKIVKYVTKNTYAMVIGNLVLTCSKKDAEQIRKNCIDTKYKNYHEFQITDKQFGKINFTNVDYNGYDVNHVVNYKKTKMPNLVVYDKGKIVLVPVTNMQFMGTTALNRTSLWI